MAGGLEPEDL